MAAIGVGHGSQQASSGDDEPEDLTPSFNDDEDERYTGSMMEAWVQARAGDEEASYGHTDTFTHLQVRGRAPELAVVREQHADGGGVAATELVDQALSRVLAPRLRDVHAAA